MGIRAPENGLQRFELRPGVAGFPPWSGHQQDGDSGSNPPSKFRYAQNVRFRSGEVVDRPGYAKINDTVLGSSNSCVRGLIDYHVNTARNKLWIVTIGCLGFSGENGATFWSYDPEQQTQIQALAYYTGALDKVLPIAEYEGDLYFGDNSLVRIFRLSIQDYGGGTFQSSGRSNAVPLEEFAGYTIATMLKFDGKLFIGLANGATSKIVTWDGISIRDDLTGINPPVTMVEWRDQLVVGFAAASNYLKLRQKGFTPSWTTVTPGAGTVAAYGENSMLSYRDDLWIANGGTDLWKYDGTTLASVRTVATAVSVRTLAELNEYLYYGWNTGTGVGTARVGRYYGINTTFEDIHKNLGAQFTLDGPIYRMVAYKSSLVAGLSGTRVVLSPGRDTPGTWLDTSHPKIVSALGFPPAQFLVY